MQKVIYFFILGIVFIGCSVNSSKDEYINQLETEISQQDIEIETLKKQKTDIEKQLSILNEDYSNLLNEKNKLLNEKQFYENKISELSKELSDLQIKNKSASAQIAQIETLKTQKQNLEQQLSEIENQLKENQTALSDLQTQLKLIKEKLDKSNSELESFLYLEVDNYWGEHIRIKAYPLFYHLNYTDSHGKQTFWGLNCETDYYDSYRCSISFDPVSAYFNAQSIYKTDKTYNNIPIYEVHIKIYSGIRTQDQIRIDSIDPDSGKILDETLVSSEHGMIYGDGYNVWFFYPTEYHKIDKNLPIIIKFFIVADEQDCYILRTKLPNRRFYQHIHLDAKANDDLIYNEIEFSPDDNIE